MTILATQVNILSPVDHVQDCNHIAALQQTNEQMGTVIEFVQERAEPEQKVVITNVMDIPLASQSESKPLSSFLESLTRVTDDSSESNSTVTPLDPRLAVVEETTLTADDLALLERVTTPVPCNTTQPGFIPILEARGGIDKGLDGLRKDTMPIALAIAATNKCRTAIYHFLEESSLANDDADVAVAVTSNNVVRKLFLTQASAVVVRVNPGTLTPYSQAKVDNILRELHNAGIQVMIHPDVQLGMGAKDALYKIRNLKCGLLDTEVYYTADEFMTGFRKTIAFRPRVIKQNRGSMGEGVWICKLKDDTKYCSKYGDEIVDLDEELVLVEANDNHTEYHTVREFMEFCLEGRTDQSGKWTSTGRGRYLDGGRAVGAMLVDQRFLPRIVEGEVRCNIVGSKLVELVHKKPKEGCFSATLLSGAVYTVHKPDDPKFKNLVEALEEDLPKIMGAVGLAEHPLPLLWSVDYIFGEKDEYGNDTFHVGEFNSTCVGITKQPKLCELVGTTAVERAFGEHQ